MSLDPETEQQLREGERALKFINHPDYQWAKEKLEALMQAIDSLSSLDNRWSNERLGQEARASKKAQGIVRSWFDVLENSAAQYAAYVANLQKRNKEPLIVNFTDKN